MGKAIIYLINCVKLEFPIVITGVGFFIIQTSHYLGEVIHDAYHISFHLEPLLICMAAGFTVQNYSKHGTLFLLKMDRVSLPIYIAFFAITGASIDLEILKTGWILGLVIFAGRLIMLYIGSFLSGWASGDEPRIYKYSWMGFITQAGVSLGLLTEIVRRFPEIGVPVQSILITAITINQVAGPIAFKYALRVVGESRITRAK